MPSISRATRRNNSWRGQPRVPGGSSAGGEWASGMARIIERYPSASPFTTTQDLPQPGEAPHTLAPHAQPPEQPISPERQKELDSAASFLNKSAARFESEGGTIDSETDAVERDYAINSMDGLQAKMGPGFYRDSGVNFTNAAIRGSLSKGPGSIDHVSVAYAGGDVAGALTWWTVPGAYSVAHVDLLGSTGIVHGTGTALMKSQIKEIASQGLSVVGTPTFAALPLYRRLGGIGETPRGPLGTVATRPVGGRRAWGQASDSTLIEWSMSANEIKYLASKLT